MELDSNCHSVFLLYYHLVLVVKYRRNVFDDTISEFAKRYVCKNWSSISYYFSTMESR